MESYNSFNVARQQVLEAAKLINLDDATREFLSTPQLEVNFTIPVKMDSGKTKIFEAFRIQYNYARGPAKGGIRFHPQETIVDRQQLCDVDERIDVCVKIGHLQRRHRQSADDGLVKADDDRELDQRRQAGS